MAKTISEVKAGYLADAKAKVCGAWVVKDPSTGLVVANSAGKFRHSFDGGKSWVQAVENAETLYRSADGHYYAEADLPEQSDEFCTQRYAAEVRSERNARISDTDSYVQLSDVTAQKSAKSKRSALTDEEKAEILAYRTALRDLPEATGWPFVDFPAAPSCIAVEVQEKINRRVAMRAAYAR